MELRRGNWRVQRLGEICKLEYGNNLTEKMRNGGPVPVFGSAGIVGWHDKSLTSSPTLIIGRKGSVGNVFYSPVPCFPIDTTYFVEELECKEDLRWLNLFLGYYDLRKLNMATAVPGLSRSIAHLIEIPLPSFEEQKQIVSLFQSIETAFDQVETQEENIKSLQKIFINGLLEEKPHFGTLLSENNISKMKFGAVADCIEQHDKEKMGVTRFVGLENIESGDLKIRTWGNISDGTTFTKRFKFGDILFGKRRSYLKKVAVADFDGICSGDILVFRTKKEAILPELLPHYVASEAFIRHAVTNSAGSLSPRTKWKDLREFEFSIPDLKTQGTVSEVLNQIQELLKQFREQKETLKTLKQNLLNEILG